MSSVKENGFSNSNKVAVKPPKANQERPELGTTSTNESSTPSNGRSMLEPSFLKQVTELILESNLVGKGVKNDGSLVEFMKPKDLEVRLFSFFFSFSHFFTFLNLPIYCTIGSVETKGGKGSG